MPFSTARPTPLKVFSSRAGRCLGIAGLWLLFTTDALQTAVADGETRTLTIHHTHTDENITITYKRGGRYDDAALAKLNHFLRDWRNNEATTMDPRLFDIVWEVYQEVGGKEPIQIISAYRSPVTNAMLRRRSRGVAQFSQHMLGKAMDFAIPGVPLEQVRIAGLRLQRGGVGYYPTSGSPFVHLDVGSVRHWPRMSHDALARVFPNGRTVHVPSDGQPLPGYELALADLERRGAAPSSVSLASARQAGVITGEAAGKPKRSLLAKLFGVGGEDDDEAQGAAPVAQSGRGKSAADSAPAAQLAAAVPMPRVRPLAREPQPSAPAVLASAQPAAAPASSDAPSPAEIVRSRGLWTAAAVAAADSGARAAAPRERLVWRTGPQGQSATVSPTAQPPAAPVPRARPPVTLASAAADTTATVPVWPINAPARDDELPSDLVLAYAAPGPSAADAAATRAAAPMGALRTNATVVARTPVAARQTASRPAATARLVDNPWLRGVMLSPSIHAAMDVAMMGRANYRELVRFMQKPASSVAMRFSEEPELEASSEAFSGRAVAFMPTVTFGTVTAGLN